MKTFQVDIYFTSGPTFGMRQEAQSSKVAEDEVLSIARQCGYTSTVKRIKSYEVQR